MFFLLHFKIAVGMEYFVCKWPHWHQNTCTQIFVTFFVVFMGGKDNIYNTTKKLQACFLDFKSPTTTIQLCCFTCPPNHSQIFCQAPGTPVLVLRWEREAEAMRWYQHLEAATRQSRSAREILRDVPLLSVLVVEINSR